MSDKPQEPDDNLRPHIYDGIQEYDNRLPNWWLWTFYGACIFSVLYWFSWYDAEITLSDAELVEAQMAEVEEARLAAIGEISNETLWQMSSNPGFIEAGAGIYQDKCVACHGAALDGGIGLNLVDTEWKWGNEALSVYAIVANGSPDKTAGMQAWLNELGPQKVSQVVAYVLSHHSEEEMLAAETLNPPLGL
jgi:cytochrome c oxidase cbb3-type subunit 3